MGLGLGRISTMIGKKTLAKLILPGAAVLVFQFVLFVPKMKEIASPPADNVNKWNEVVELAKDTEGDVLFEMMPTAMMRSGKKEFFMSTVLLAYMQHKGKWNDDFVVAAVRSKRFAKIFAFDDWFFMPGAESEISALLRSGAKRLHLKAIGRAIGDNYVKAASIRDIEELSSPLTISIYVPKNNIPGGDEK